MAMEIFCQKTRFKHCPVVSVWEVHYAHGKMLLGIYMVLSSQSASQTTMLPAPEIQTPGHPAQ